VVKPDQRTSGRPTQIEIRDGGTNHEYECVWKTYECIKGTTFVRSRTSYIST